MYHRRIKLRDYFRDENLNKEPLVLPSTWEPDWGTLSNPVRDLIKKDIRFFHSFQPGEGQVHSHSFSLEEKRAIKELQDNRQIVIKPADKGSKIVIMDKQQYRQEANRQLDNNKYYKKISTSIQLGTQLHIRQIIKQLFVKKYISAKQRDYLFGPDDPRPRQFYLLPKIHKQPDTWTVPFEIPPGRPIVSDCSSCTYNVSQYIDLYLGPLSIRHSSYLKDTYHFLQMIRPIVVPEQAFLFTIDIDSLYTNINTQMGLEAVKNIFLRYPDAKRPDAEILRLLELCLINNDFQFDGNYYLQIEGTAMGQRYAPSYANIYMSEWEREALAKCTMQPVFYLRFLDDIIGAWAHGEESFKVFVQTLNTHHHSIKLKYETYHSHINFLDTTVFFEMVNGEKKMKTKVFFKPTDTHALLHRSSYHPSHTFRGIVKSQILRFHRICSKDSDLQEAIAILFKSLRKRGYSRSFLRRVHRETFASLHPSSTYSGRTRCLGGLKVELGENPMENGPRPPRDLETGERIEKELLLPFVCTFHREYAPFLSGIQRHFRAMQPDLEMARQGRVIRALRKNPTLRDILVRAKLEGRMKTPPDKLLDYLIHRPMASNPHSGKTWPITGKFSLVSKNLVYAIQCSVCGLMYVGETGARMGDRLQQHLYNIRTFKSGTFVAAHFREHTEGALKIMGLQANPGWSEGQRRRTERIWMDRLGTHEPTGLNVPI